MFREQSIINQSPVALARQNAPKSRDLKPLKLLPTLARPHLGKLVIGFAAVIISGICTLSIGQAFKKLIDSGLAAGNMAELTHSLEIMAGLVVILTFASYARL